MMRPLLVQTAALGPSEFLRAPEHQPDFRGCRYISVAADVIEKVQYIKHEQIKSYQPFDWVVDKDVVLGGGVVVRQ